MAAWSESCTCLSPAESGPGNPSGLGDGWLGSWRHLKAKCTSVYFQTSDFLVLKGVGFGLYQDALGMRCCIYTLVYPELIWMYPRWRCCSSWRAGNAAVSREVVWAKSFCQLNVFAAEPQCPAVWQGGLLRATIPLAGCASWSDEVIFVHGCLKLNCSTKADSMT